MSIRTKSKINNAVKIMIEKDAYMPTKAHDTDAGYDLYSRRTAIIKPHRCVIFDTGVHMALPDRSVGMIKSKSGLYIKNDIVSEGVVDEGYTGSIVVKLHNIGNNPYKVKAGDKISQIVIVPYIPCTLEAVDQLDETDRGNNGFGSSGR